MEEDNVEVEKHLEALRLTNGLSENIFRAIHSDCLVEERRTGNWRENGRFYDWDPLLDYTNIIPEVVLRCKKHGVQSIVFDGKPYNA